MAQDEIQDNKEQRGIFRSIARFFQPSVEHLINCLNEGYGLLTTAKDAENKLVKRGEEALPQLIEATEGQDPHIRACAVRILGKIEDPTAVPILQSLVQDVDPRVRSEVFPALANMGATGHLILMKIQPGYKERYVIERMKSKAKAGSVNALEYLIKKMKYDNNISVCEALREFLEFAEVADALVGKIADNRDPYGCPVGSAISRTARNVLSSMEGHARPALFAALNMGNSLTETAAADLLADNTEDIRDAELVRAMLTYHNKWGQFSKQIYRLAECYPDQLRSGPNAQGFQSRRKAFSRKKAALPEPRIIGAAKKLERAARN